MGLPGFCPPFKAGAFFRFTAFFDFATKIVIHSNAKAIATSRARFPRRCCRPRRTQQREPAVWEPQQTGSLFVS